MSGTGALFFSAAGMLLVFLFGADLAFEAALGASLGSDAVAPDLIASPISFGVLGAGAATSSSSSSSSEECCSNSTIGSTFLHHLPLFLSFFSTATTGSLGVGFSGILVEALAFGIGCLPAGLLIFKPGLVLCLEPCSFLSTTFFEVASSSAT